MDRRIHKFTLDITDHQTIEVHSGFISLSVQHQGSQLQLWGMHDLTEDKRSLDVYVVGTGNEVPTGVSNYVGTVQQGGGLLIWHVFTGLEF